MYAYAFAGRPSSSRRHDRRAPRCLRRVHKQSCIRRSPRGRKRSLCRVCHRGQAFRPIFLCKFFLGRTLGEFHVIPAGVLECGRGVKPVPLRCSAPPRSRQRAIHRCLPPHLRFRTALHRRLPPLRRFRTALRRPAPLFLRLRTALRRPPPLGVFGRRFGSRVGRLPTVERPDRLPRRQSPPFGGACCGGRKFDLQFLRLSRIGQLAHKAHAHLGRGRGCRRRSGCRLHRRRGRFGRRRRGRFGRRRRGRFGRRRRGRFGRRRRGRLGRRRYGRLDRLGAWAPR